MATMKSTRHEIIKEKWRELVKIHNESGLPVKQWCNENNISPNQYYYWLKVIRQDSLIQAGTLAVTGKSQFVEITKSKLEYQPSITTQTCAVLRLNGNEIEILNGADPNTLGLELSVLGRS